MSARKAGGSDTATGASPAGGRAAALTVDPAAAAGLRPALFCKPNHAHLRPLASLDSDRPPASSGGSSGRPSVYPEHAPSVRITDPGTSPDLFNPAKGLSMEKTAHSFLQLAMKSVPVTDLLQSAHLAQSTPLETVDLHGYTLCEVQEAKRQFVPPRFEGTRATC